MTAATPWFEVDRKGLAKLMAGRGKEFVLYELLQNAWDQNVTEVKVTLEVQRGTTIIMVEDDDPKGFEDLAHAYTLFAESKKKTNAEKRGRFNLGEKLVLALAREATIYSTNGGVRFDKDGRHRILRGTERGSIVRVELPMTQAEQRELDEAVYRVICPPGIKTTFNGNQLPAQQPIAIFEAHLPTQVVDDDGVMRATRRKTTVRVYEPAAGEPARLYEMGIPVVEMGDRFHVDVQQKVPLNTDRDNVTPAYLRAIRVEVLNATHSYLTEQDAAQTWVKEACSDDRTSTDAVRQAVKLRFGDRAVTYDPSDPEANKRSAAEGRPLVYAGNLSGSEWAQVRRAGALQPAGVVTPSPKPYSADGTLLNLIPASEWTDGMQRVMDFAKWAGRELLNRGIVVQIAREFSWPYAATYGPSGELTFNLCKLGHDFFEHGITNEVIDLLIHEFGHEYEGDHLSANYYKALTDLGARFVRLALDWPEFFR